LAVLVLEELVAGEGAVYVADDDVLGGRVFGEEEAVRLVHGFFVLVAAG